MATNPMQKKARMSFILGMVVALLLSSIVIVILFMQLNNYKKKEQDNAKATKKIYVLTQDVKSGQEVTSDMYKQIDIDSNIVPKNAINDIEILANYSLQDKEGNEVYTKEGKLMLQRSDSSNPYELKMDDKTGNYYIEKDGNNEYVDLVNVPLIAKVSMLSNTVLTKDLLSKGKLSDDLRREEYNSFVLPMDLVSGDYVDVRLMLPSGQNYVVASKKEVDIPVINGMDSTDTVWLNVTEGEILTISSAIVDAYRIDGAKLYLVKYTDPGMQKGATPTYITTPTTLDLIQRDPNIIQRAKTELNNRLNSDTGAFLRNQIDEEKNKQEDSDEKLKTNMQKSIKDSQDERKSYLNGLSGAIN